MDFLDPVLGTVTGLEPGQLSAIISFTLKALLFCLPFVILGLLFERDVYRVPVTGRITKVLILLVFVLPVLLFAIFNYMAPGIPESFWESHQVLETLWIMEGSFAPVVLAGLCVLYFFLYAAEVVRGDLRD
jgi:hypothetical protein